MNKNNKKSFNPKHKGNHYERKFVKELSYWLFKDPDFLKRHYNSGADKSVYRGDAVPMKRLPDDIKEFPIYVEIKSGYKQMIPTFWSYNKIEEWYLKCISDSINTPQRNILLICQFKNKPTIVVSNVYFEDIIFMCLPIKRHGVTLFAYVYFWRDLLQKDPNELLHAKECG